MSDAIRRQITDSIASHLKAGVKPWRHPLAGGRPRRTPLRHNGERYRGTNVLALWSQQVTKGYASEIWMTYKQALSLGGQVRKGEKSTKIVYFQTVERENENTDKINIVPILKQYSVFNTEQIDGLSPSYYPNPPTLVDSVQEIDLINLFMSNAGVSTQRWGDIPAYSPTQDVIVLPETNKFRDEDSWAETALHELVHWTGHKSRLDRDQSGRRRAYAYEELVAELGSAFLCAELGINQTTDNSASYINSWLGALEDDPKFIFSAATAAQAACDYLWQFQPSAQEAA